MREMRWSWTDLQATPDYVRRFCWDFTLARRNAGADSGGGGFEGWGDEDG